MTKKLAAAALLMFLIIATLIGSTLIKNDFLNPEKEPSVIQTVSYFLLTKSISLKKHMFHLT